MLKPRLQSGVTLVELMVGVAIGLVVLLGMSSVYVNTTLGSRTTTSANQMNQDLRAMMDIMVNDLRRAGYWGASTFGSVNPFLLATTMPQISTLGTDRDCIVYSYDATYATATPGVTPGVDFFGFLLNATGAIQALDQNGASTLADTRTSCANLPWQDVTDARAINVTRLSFDTIGSQCIAFIAANYQPNNSATYTAWTTTSGNGAACSASASNAPSPYPNTSTHSFVETRQINITLVASSRTDTGLPTQTLSETVLVRNNRVVVP